MCTTKKLVLQQAVCHGVYLLSRDIAYLLSVSGVSGIHKLLTLPDIQSHMVLWKHVVATTEGLASLKHNQSTVSARCVLPIQVAACNTNTGGMQQLKPVVAAFHCASLACNSEYLSLHATVSI